MEKNYTVGIPARNEQNNIQYTLDSILGQTIPPSKILVCANGCSEKDKTYEIVQGISRYEPTVNAIHSKPGKPNAWNEIVENIHTNNVMFCDGDVGVGKYSAESFLEEMAKNEDLILIGGFRKQIKKENPNFFTKYFTENVSTETINQSFASGQLYMLKLQEYMKMADSLGAEPMPTDIINEDKYLEIISNPHSKMTDKASFTSHPVASFEDWMKTSKRIIAGDMQLKKQFPELMQKRFSGMNMKDYLNRFKKIDSLSNKLGIASLFALRRTMMTYYKYNDTLDYKVTWDETKTTKVAHKK